ncbi:PREDICTED: UPF0505 protein C16orf62 homolog [Ceratosolen solmsi marchali]|uniref:UPF0505 protein C16orf62 homolog n=1 Tax=Ceratosolen solmsi marchali TaxID=326594 RepID=A0AAJ6YT78_9HYME|nr:PREDICTED: UPF0505 protein C16orf62 homolog [Ceratosolen solmsi marchali]
MTDIEWFERPVNYKIKKTLYLEEVIEHPLKPVTVTMIDGRCGTKRNLININSSLRTPSPVQTVSINIGSVGNNISSHSSLDGSDPLTQFMKEEMDPLSRMASNELNYSANIIADDKKMKDKIYNVEPWTSRRVTVLNKYTTLEKLSIETSFLPGGEKIVMKVQPSGFLVDKVKTRLEQLDDFEDDSVRQMQGLTQQEYIIRIEQLNNELVHAWNSDQRVKALKIVIQCAKLLVDTSVISFYPSKFVLITDILEIFGKLVYKRLKIKAECIKPGFKASTSLPDNFTSDMVSENAKETCQNWFYKIASIRELVPRLYVEMAIIKAYNFLTTNEFNTVLTRITRMIRGIGDPLVAVYARCYLCRVGFALRTSNPDFVKENFYDFINTYRQLFSQSTKYDLIKQNICLHSYLNLYTPALDWILQVLAVTASDSLLTEVFTRCKQESNNALLLNTILHSFKPIYIASHSLEFINLIEMSQDTGYPQCHLYRSLGECLIQERPPKDECQSVLNTIWKYMKNLKDSIRFMYVMEIWIQFIVIYFTASEINLFLGEIINHLGPSREFEYFYPQLQNIIEKLVADAQDFDSILTMDNFLPLINLFQKESIKVEICKTIVQGLNKQNSLIIDPIMINALMFIMKIMHDTVSALTVEDEKRQIGQLICNLIQRIDYNRDFEKQLNFYVEARAAFHNLDIVHVQLVQYVNRLSIDTRKIVRGHHTRRTSAFVRACAAFCFITIPSLTIVYTKLQLYLLSGQVALLNQCYGQADACFKAALSLVPEMPKSLDIDGQNKSSEPYLLSYLSNFLSTLLVVPDSPEHGVLYLMRGLLNAVQRCFDHNNKIKSHLYLRVLDLLSTITQETYLYHVDKVDSNDKLYGSDHKFVNEVNKMCSKVFEELLSYLKHLGSSNQLDKQSILAFELFVCMIIRADLTKPSLLHMAVNLWNLSQKRNTVDSKFKLKILEYIMKKSQLQQFQHFTDMLKEMLK